MKKSGLLFCFLMVLSLMMMVPSATADSYGHSTAAAPAITSYDTTFSMSSGNVDGSRVSDNGSVYMLDGHTATSNYSKNWASTSNGYLVGGITLGGGRGLSGNSTYFDGVDDSIELTPYTFGSAVTFSVTAYPTNDVGLHVLLRQQDAADKSCLAIFSSGHTIYAQLTNTLTTQVGVIVDSMFYANQWAQWTGVYDGSKLHFYKNGVEIGTAQDLTGDVKTSVKSIFVGRYQPSGLYPFIGYMNDARIYSRALSGSETVKLYQDSFKAMSPVCLPYSYAPTANQTITSWSLRTNASFLSQSASGVVSGVPTVIGSWYVNVSCTNLAGTGWQNYSLRSYLTVAPLITASPLHSIAEMTTFIIPILSDQTISNWSLSTDVSWLHQYSNGTLYGESTENSQGNWTYTVTGSNSNGIATYTNYIWVQDTIYGSEEMDTQLILMLFFFIIMTLFNIWGMMKGMGVVQIVAFSLLFGGMFVDMQLWNDLWILPMSLVIINVLILFIGVSRNKR